MNYGGLKTALINRMSLNTSGDPAIGDAGTLINEGMHFVEISAPGGWPWQHRTTAFTTTATVAVYPFSEINTSNTISKVLSVKVLVGNAWQPLTYISPDEAQVDWPYRGDTSAPVGYSIEGSSLYLYPPQPGARYYTQVRSIIAEPDLNADADLPLMPSIYHGSIITAGLILYYDTLQDLQKAQVAQQQLDRWLQRMTTYARQSGQLPRVRLRNG